MLRTFLTGALFTIVAVHGSDSDAEFECDHGAWDGSPCDAVRPSSPKDSRSQTPGAKSDGSSSFEDEGLELCEKPESLSSFLDEGSELSDSPLDSQRGSGGAEPAPQTRRRASQRTSDPPVPLPRRESMVLDKAYFSKPDRCMTKTLDHIQECSYSGSGGSSSSSPKGARPEHVNSASTLTSSGASSISSSDDEKSPEILSNHDLPPLLWRSGFDRDLYNKVRSEYFADPIQKSRDIYDEGAIMHRYEQEVLKMRGRWLARKRDLMDTDGKYYVGRRVKGRSRRKRPTNRHTSKERKPITRHSEAPKKLTRGITVSVVDRKPNDDNEMFQI